MSSAWSKVKVTGPLAPYARRFGEDLQDKGYTELSAGEQLRLMSHLSRWMLGQGLEASELSAEAIDAYVVARQSQGYTARLAPSSLGRLREFLGSEGVLSIPTLIEGPPSAEEELLDRYRRYLVDERGLVERVIDMYLKTAALLLQEHPGLAGGTVAIGPGEVSSFCVREIPKRGRSVANNLVAGLRSFLRFLYLEGLSATALAQAVPRISTRKGAGLPRGVAPATVAKLLVSCDRRTRLGKRDYAMLLLLARLGLRAGEVAGLRLEDIDWRAGELVVHGKGRRRERLPLPDDVGTAVVAYLQRGRPRIASRAVFVRAIAPLGPLSPARITGVVHDACDRAGTPKLGAHRLRHSLATKMLRSGGSLSEVSQVLRHSRLSTTAIYAKVDFVQLAVLVVPWPGDRS